MAPPVAPEASSYAQIKRQRQRVAEAEQSKTEQTKKTKNDVEQQ